METDPLDSVLKCATVKEFIDRFGLNYKPIFASLRSAETYDQDRNDRILLFVARILDEFDDAYASWTYAKRYFSSHVLPYSRFTPRQNSAKRIKTYHRDDKARSITDEEVLWSCLKLLETDIYFHELWDWKGIFPLTKRGDFSLSISEESRWLAVQCLDRLLNLGSEHTLQVCLVELGMSRLLLNQFALKYGNNEEKAQFVSKGNLPNLFFKDNDDSSVTKVNGIVLKKRSGIVSDYKFVQVPSLEVPFKLATLAASAGRPCLISGATGSGKTTLIEYLAHKTGRVRFEDFHCIRVNDQTDGRSLLGNYVCAEVPGQFKWKRGILAKAVEEGDWLLIEDVDLASPDVLSLLLQLVESNSLYIPNYGRTIFPGSGFQLFFTDRAGSSTEKDSLKLKRTPYYIQLSPFVETELASMVSERFAALNDVSLKLVQTYQMVATELDRSLSRNRRQLSTRDLFKWCSRISGRSSDRVVVFYDGVDALCRFIPDSELQKQCATVIGRFLNLTRDEISHMMFDHHPKLEIADSFIEIGRCKMPRNEIKPYNAKFSLTKSSSVLLEFLSSSVAHREPVLLVGETGVGKTSTVQFLSQLAGKTLHVVNMSQQSDNSDLLGSYKPVDSGVVVQKLRKRFESLFAKTFSLKENRKFLSHISSCANGKDWMKLTQLLSHVVDKAIKFAEGLEDVTLLEQWRTLKDDVLSVQRSLSNQANITFSFVRGVLSEAIVNGDWILLDEINLAEPETLEVLADILDADTTTVHNTESLIVKHRDFRVFACMNPATDVGKSDLPSNLRSRFTEYFIREPTEKSELIQIVSKYLADLNQVSASTKIVQNIVDFFLLLRRGRGLCDGNGNSPVFSLRTLCRALQISARNPCSNVMRSIFEAFSLCFLTELDRSSYPIVLRLLMEHLGGGNKSHKRIWKEEVTSPSDGKYIVSEGFPVRIGHDEPFVDEKYILTESVRKNLKDLSRIVSMCDLPILIQGETSVGKTSLITYLARASGNRCLRINNHEHTDIQEYVGTYTVLDSGVFAYQEGVLVDAMRNGSWIILDELNLAPTEVLEALNRVLDDNRELFIAETQTIVKADPNFRIFATQNPAGGVYAGRKVLSRAFRNRFIQLHFDELPSYEVETIVERNCGLAPSMSKKMVKVMTELQKNRKSSAAFEGKRGYITLRDLFRWGNRFHQASLSVDDSVMYDWNRHLGEEGYMVLASRIRHEDEDRFIKETIERVMKVRIEPDLLSFTAENTALATVCEQMFLLERQADNESDIVWTKNAQRMAVLLLHALRFNEPVLLVGETGCGKTTIVQEIAKFLKRNLKIINCHLHTETSDFIGSLRPSRDKNTGVPFTWYDGPLVEAMKNGDTLLVDEISLADDSVIERMNSVLEPTRKLLLAERCDVSANATDEISAKSSFKLIATMNPGGDFGKKELSPALRNRFFEVWCPSSDPVDDLRLLLRRSISRKFNFAVENVMTDFLVWMSGKKERDTLSIRDLKSWIDFINVTTSYLAPECSVIHGICLVLIDGYEMMNNLVRQTDLLSFRRDCETFFRARFDWHKDCECFLWISGRHRKISDLVTNTPARFEITPFYLEKEPVVKFPDFLFKSPTPALNAFKLLRALCLRKPVLIEGTPGVGKSSIVESLAAVTGHTVVRINFSDQTEISDLFGADLPVEGHGSEIFAWRDGPLLSALKAGHWVLLDELNLASQSVLEGLNACLDHRGEIFIPELNKTFRVKVGQTKFFGCQNPYQEGGDRKGLPKSFLNRFVRIKVDPLTRTDLLAICQSRFPDLKTDLLNKIVDFVQRLKEDIDFSGFGAPWILNLRDVSRWCSGISRNNKMNRNLLVSKFAELIFVNRFRFSSDRDKVRAVYQSIFGTELQTRTANVFWNMDKVYVGVAEVERGHDPCELVRRHRIPLFYLPSQSGILENVMMCVQNKFIPILVGSECTGKTSVIRTAARLASRKLTVVTLSAGSDTNDLLGGFEQTDIVQELRRASEEFAKAIRGFARQCHNEEETCHDAIRKLRRLTVENDVENAFLVLKDVSSRFQVCKSELQCLESDYNKHGLSKFFKWVDSNLVQELTEGGWVLIDNANFCPLSVLDRLNGLLEDNGVLDMYEQGLSGGSVRRIVAHPDFRIFFNLDPKNGELSPALRNRCVEIYLDSDCQSTLILEGIEMCKALNSLRMNFTQDLNMTEVGLCLKEQLYNGFTMEEALQFTSSILLRRPRADTSNHICDLQQSLFNLERPFLFAIAQYRLLLQDKSQNFIVPYLSFATDSDISIRSVLLQNQISDPLVLTEVIGFLENQLDEEPFDKRALLRPVQENVIHTRFGLIAATLMAKNFKTISVGRTASAQAKASTSALKRYFATFFENNKARLAEKSDFSDEEYVRFDLVMMCVAMISKALQIGRSSTDEKLKILTVLWNKFNSLLSKSQAIVDYVEISIKSDVKKHLYVDDSAMGQLMVLNHLDVPFGFVDEVELNQFLPVVEEKPATNVNGYLTLDLDKTLILSQNWNRFENNLPLRTCVFFSPLFSYAMAQLNQHERHPMIVSVFMKREEAQIRDIQSRSVFQLIRDSLFPEESVSIRDHGARIDELKSLRCTLIRNYDTFLRWNKSKFIHIMKRLRRLLNSLCDSLGISSQESVTSMLEGILKKSDLLGCEDVTTALKEIRQCVTNFCDDDDDVLYGKVQAMIGFILFKFSVRLSVIDVAEKLRIESEYYVQMTDSIRTQLRHFDVCNSLHLRESTTSTHPHFERLLRHIYEFEDALAEVKIPLRKENYSSLLADVIRLDGNVGTTTLPLLMDVTTDPSSSIDKFRTLKTTLNRFCETVVSKYPSFCDIYIPILDGITDMVEGVDLVMDLSTTSSSLMEAIDRFRSLVPNESLFSREYLEANPLKLIEDESEIESVHTLQAQDTLPRNFNLLKWVNILPLHVKECSRQIRSLSNDGNEMEFGRVKAALPEFLKIRQRLLQNLELFPENPILVENLEVVDRILGFSVTDPVSKFQEGIVIFLPKLKNWNQNAPKIHQVDSEGLKLLLFNWQKMELRNIESEFAKILKNYGENSFEELWFVLDSINLGRLKTKERKLMLALFRYLCSSSLGEFEKRVSLTHRLTTSYASLCPRIVAEFKIVLKYFDRHVPSIQSAIKSKTEELIKKAQQALKVEFISFQKDKSSSNKSSSCYKQITNEYCEFLGESCIPYLGEKFSAESASLSEAISIPNLRVSGQGLEESSVTFIKQDGYAVSKKACSLVNDLKSTLVSRIKISLDDLKDVTASYSEIPHSKLVSDDRGLHKYLKILSEILSDMKSRKLSFKYGLIHDVSLLNWTQTKVLGGQRLHDSFFKLEKLKDLYVKPKPHLNPDLMHRSEGYIGHGILISIVIHAKLQKIVESEDDLTIILRKLECHANKDVDIGNSWNRFFIKACITFRELHDSTLSILEQIILNEAGSSKYLCADVSASETEIREASKMKQFLIEHRNLLDEFQVSLGRQENVVDVLKRISKEPNVESDLILSVLADFKKYQRYFADRCKFWKSTRDDSTSTFIPDRTLLTSQIKSLGTKIMTAVQSYVKNCNSEFGIENFQELNEIFRREIANIGHGPIVIMSKGLLSVLELFKNTLDSDTRRLCSEILPLLTCYVDLLKSVRSRYTYMSDLLDEYLSRTLDVFIRFSDSDFKQKDDEEQDDGESNQSKNGCGLGDGTGKENISKDITSEDMLEGASTKEEEKEEEEEEENPEEDDGIEAHDNFGGNYEGKDEQDSAEEDENDKEEEEELDKEKEDVDEDAELDEDLWNDEEQKSDGEPEEEGESELEKKMEEKEKKRSEKNEETRNDDGKKDEEIENQENEDEERKEEDDLDNEHADDEEKRERNDDEFSENEEEDIDFTEKLNEEAEEPEDLDLDEDLNMDENEDGEADDIEDMDDIDDDERPDFKEPEVENDRETKTTEQPNENQEGKDNVSNVPRGSQNKTTNPDEKEFGVNSEDVAMDDGTEDAGITNNDDVKRNSEEEKETKSDAKSRPKPQNRNDMSKLESNLKRNQDDDKRDENSSSFAKNLENETEEDQFAMDTMDYDQLRDMEKLENEEDDPMDPNHSDMNPPNAKNPMFEIEEENSVATTNVERSSESFFAHGTIKGMNGTDLPNTSKSIAPRSLTKNVFEPDSEQVKEWIELCRATNSLSQLLITRLRLLFEPTKANRLKGDYKTGKRLNMRKIIPYIASHFRKDKIWLKRTKVSKRDYHVLFALDDSQSMSDNYAHRMALEALATVSQAFNVLEVGKLGVVKFGEFAELIQPFKSALTAEDGGKIVRDFTFSQTKTSIVDMLGLSVDAFAAEGAEVSNNLSRLLVIISDGRGVFHEGKDLVVEKLRRASSQNVFIMFLIVETKNDSSILDIRFPVFDADNNLLRIESYMDNFPFDYYILLKDLKSLPYVLCGALQQWFEMFK